MTLLLKLLAPNLRTYQPLEYISSKVYELEAHTFVHICFHLLLRAWHLFCRGSQPLDEAANPDVATFGMTTLGKTSYSPSVRPHFAGRTGYVYNLAALRNCLTQPSSHHYSYLRQSHQKNMMPTTQIAEIGITKSPNTWSAPVFRCCLRNHVSI